MSTDSCGVVQSIVALIGRILFGALYVALGLYSAFHFQDVLQSMPVILRSETLLIIITILELLGGLLVILGWHTRLGAFLLFLIIALFTGLGLATPVPNDQSLMYGLIQLLDNLALAGGSLYIMAFGAGAVSFDRLRCCSRRKNL